MKCGSGSIACADYVRAIERIHSHGIAVQAGIVFGFDNDKRAIFGETLDFLEAAGVQNATFNILTPFPGTRLYQRLEAEGRILTRDWSKYNGRADVVFRPRQMSPEELLAGYRVCEQAILLMEKRMQALVTLSGRAVLDFALEFGVRVRFFHKLDCKSSATIRVGSQGGLCSREHAVSDVSREQAISLTTLIGWAGFRWGHKQPGS